MFMYTLEHIISLSYRTTWWMFTKLDRDEVLIVLHLCLGFSAYSTQGQIQGRAISQKLGQWGVPSPKDFFFRLEGYSNYKPNIWFIVAVLTDFTNMAVMLSDLLRNLTFNRSAHCTQVSDQCPLGLLLWDLYNKNKTLLYYTDYEN